jgi:competence protein ComEA
MNVKSLAVGALVVAVGGVLAVRAVAPKPAMVIAEEHVASPMPSTAPHRRWAAGSADGVPPAQAPRTTAVVYVAGAVAKPGVYTLAREKRVNDAVRAAGGPLADADLIAINLAAPLSDGTEIVVRRIGEAAALRAPAPHSARAQTTGAAPASARRPRATGRGTPRKPLPTGHVDINVADAAEIATLPGIGMGLAERIVAFRDANGPFADVSDLLDVSGITDRRLDAIAAYITVGS